MASYKQHLAEEAVAITEEHMQLLNALNHLVKATTEKNNEAIALYGEEIRKSSKKFSQCLIRLSNLINAMPDEPIIFVDKNNPFGL